MERINNIKMITLLKFFFLSPNNISGKKDLLLVKNNCKVYLVKQKAQANQHALLGKVKEEEFVVQICSFNIMWLLNYVNSLARKLSQDSHILFRRRVE